jgi:hypothetical protein
MKIRRFDAVKSGKSIEHLVNVLASVDCQSEWRLVASCNHPEEKMDFLLPRFGRLNVESPPAHRLDGPSGQG